MNIINLNNFNEWYLRFCEGKLSEAEDALFVQFLEEHPELMDEELEKGEKLVAPTMAFENKEHLKKEASPIEHMAMFDYLAIKQTETGLTDGEQQHLRQYIAQNPSLGFDVELYAKSKLVADQGIVYGKKAALKRHSLAQTFVFKALRYTSAAAVIAVLIYVGWPSAKQTTDNMAVVAQTDKPTPEKTQEDKPVQHKSDSIASPKARTPKAKPVQKNDIPTLEPNERLLAALPQKNAVDAIEQPRVNAYEEGLNTMMPQYLDNQIEISKLMALTSVEESGNLAQQRANLPVTVIENGVKVFNFLGKGRVKVDKFYDANGNLVAYKVKGDNVEWSRKVK